jgi:hypothetical protein
MKIKANKNPTKDIASQPIFFQEYEPQKIGPARYASEPGVSVYQ